MDTNFDSLYDRLQRNIYNNLKGHVREHVVHSQLSSKLPQLHTNTNLHCADVGGGFGAISAWLAGLGHRVDYCDYSHKMCEHARAIFEKKNVKPDQIRIFEGRFQEHLQSSYDLVHCQAVLEWLDNPIDGLKHLMRMTKVDGHLVLFFYNEESIRFKNLLKANIHASNRQIKGDGNSLTPINPLNFKAIELTLIEGDFKIEHHFGVRCFVDYLSPRADLSKPGIKDGILQRELELSDVEPYRSLARYIGIIATRNR